MNNKLNKCFLVLSTILVLSTSLWGQGILFNKRAGISNDNESRTIISNDTGYVTIGINIDSLTGKRCLLFASFNLQGELQLKKTYCNPVHQYYIGAPNSSTKTLVNPGYVYCASITDTVTDTIIDGGDILLVKYDFNGDTIFTHRYNFGNYDVGYSVVEANDGGYVLCGTSRQLNPYQLCGRLIKTDNIGNIEWSHTYSCDYESYLINIIKTLDGGYCMSGQIRPSNQFNYSQTQIIKVDSVGNQDWIKYLGGSKDEYFSSITLLSDGNVHSSGMFTLFQNGPEQQLSCKGYNVKLQTSTGDTTFTRKFGDNANVINPYAVYETNQNKIIIAGAAYGWINPDVFDSRQMGFIAKTEGNGDSIWFRKYFIDTINVASVVIYSIKPALDGGIIACGKINYFGDISDTWLLKTDENGCIDEGCINGIEELEEDDYRLFIYPNPAQDYVSIDLPITHNKATLQIINMQGQIIKNIAINSGGLQRIDTSTLPKGIYIFAIQSNNTLIGREKVVVY